MIALLLLTASNAFSQGATKDSITLSFDTGKQIALELVEKDRLEALYAVSTIELSKYISLTENLREITSKQDLQIGLLKANIKSLESQLELEQDKKNTPFADKLLFGLGGFCVGALVLLVGSI